MIIKECQIYLKTNREGGPKLNFDSPSLFIPDKYISQIKFFRFCSVLKSWACLFQVAVINMLI